MAEYKVLAAVLPEMAEIMNVIPGEVFRIKDEDTLLILQRRMEECQLKEELVSFNEIFAMKNGCTIAGLRVAMVSYIKIKILAEAEQDAFTPKLYRELIKEFHAQSTKVSNIIHLSEMNVMTADEYQREQIELTMAKNKAFLEAFNIEISAIEKKIERLPKDEEKGEEIKTIARYKEKEEQLPKSVSPRPSVLGKIQKHILDAREKRKMDERLKEVEKSSAETRCKEIPFYEKSLVYTDQFPCKDIPAYSILKRKNNIYFGLTQNIGRNSYNNEDQSLIELTEATDEFLQFMEVDLLSGEYALSTFSQQERAGLTLYFNFMSECFKKHIGVTLTVQEYLEFKKYYNRLVLKMFELEKQAKEDYYKALILADNYMSYMESYDLECADDEETIVQNIINEKNDNYIEDIRLIIQNHIFDEGARADLEEIIKRIKGFHQTEDTTEEDKPEEKMCDMEVLPLQSQQMTMQQIPVMPMLPMGINQGIMQIVVQILNQEHEIVDEALYSGSNIAQALFDYQNKGGYIKRLGLRSNGQDVFYQEEKERDE